jgi:hypothetical protein
MIYNFTQYILESSKTNISYKLYLHKNFINIFKNTIFKNNKIAGILKENKIRTNEKINFVNSFLNIDDKYDIISFLNIDKLKNLYDMKDIKLNDIRRMYFNNPEIWDNRYRQTMKIGKFIKQLFGDMFSDLEVEEFVNLYKSYGTTNYTLEMVNGIDIKKYYLSNMYEYYHGGTLNTSCMRYSGAQGFLDMYSKNPEKVQLLVYKKKNNEIISGRALIWQLDEPNDRVFMDRIYYNEDNIKNIFVDYAEKENMIYKNKQNMTYLGEHVYVNDGNNINCSINMKVKLNEIKYSYYPYLDTLKYYNVKTFELSTYGYDFDMGNVIKLASTSGGYN